MRKSIEVTGKTDEAALNAGLEQLGLSRDDVSVELIERAKKGVLGFGNTPARVRISYDVPDVPDKTPPPADAPAPVDEAPTALREAQTLPVQSAAEETKVRAAAEETEKAQEAQDEVCVQIREFLSGLLAHMECEAQVRVFRAEEGYYNVQMEGKRIGALIGRRGETLDAIQQLTNYTINRKRDSRVRIRMDAEHYRQRREKTLQALAQRMAAKAVRSGRNVALEPMNAYERHVIHTALQTYDGVTTGSVGNEPNRRIVIRPSAESGL